MKPEYWSSLEAAAGAKKNRRIKRKQAAELISDHDAMIRETLEESRHIRITSIRDINSRLLEISYIYDKRIDLAPEIQFLREKLGKAVKLQARIGSDEAIEQLIRKPRRETRKFTDVRKAPGVGIAARNRLAALGVYCLEDLFGRSGDTLYRLDCELSGEAVNRRYLALYRNAARFANNMN